MRKSIVVVGLASLAFALGSCQRNTPVSSSSQEGTVSSNAVSSETPVSSTPASTFSSADAGEGDYTDQTWTGKVKIYYHRDDGAYDDKRLWVWSQGVGGDTLGETTFDNQSTVASDSYGLYKILDMGAAPWAGHTTTSISFIIKKAGTWADQSADTVCPFGRFAKYAVDNMITIYANAADGGVVETYARKEDAVGDRIGSAAFTDWKTLHVVGTGDSTGRDAATVGVCSSYNLYAFTAAYYQLSSEDKIAKKSEFLIKTGAPNAASFDISFDKNIVPNKNYYVECYFALNPTKAKAKTATYSALYDTQVFKDSYTYTVDDLGVTTSHTATTFKVWAPTSANVEVKVFMVGTPGDLMDPVTLAQNGGHIYEMSLWRQGRLELYPPRRLPR
jgi:hypothetical protein